DQLLEIHPAKAHEATCGIALATCAAVFFERRAKGPIIRQLDTRFNGNTAMKMTCWIQNERWPLEIDEVRRQQNATIRVRRRCQKLELDVDRAYARRHDEVKGIHVERVTTPRQGGAVNAHDKARYSVERSCLGMKSRQPGRIEEHQWSRTHRNGL